MFSRIREVGDARKLPKNVGKSPRRMSDEDIFSIRYALADKIFQKAGLKCYT